MNPGRRSRTWTPQADDYRRVLAEQNPWHDTGKVPEVLAKQAKRPLAEALPGRLLQGAPNRYQLVLGPRRVGKTTVLYQAVRTLIEAGVDARRVWWFRFDHPLLMRVRPDDLARLAVVAAGATPDRPAFLFVDELVYAEDWDLWLKTLYDERWPIRLAGSSSSTASLRTGRRESGVGRWEEQHLSPYLFDEYLELIGQPIAIDVGASLAETIEGAISAWRADPDLAGRRDRFMFTGGFPELLILMKDSDEDDAERLLASQRTLREDAVERAVYKDIPQAFNIDMPQTLERVLYVLAERVTGLLSPTDLCQTIDRLTQPTLDRYIGYLEQAFLILVLRNYSATESGRQRRGRKVYFYDCAIRNAALQRGLAPLKDMRERGILYENLAASHLHALSLQTQVPLFHWRDGSAEVDLIYDHPEVPLAFEIASSESHSRAALRAFQQRHPRFRQRCFLVAPNARATRPTDSASGVGTLPLDLFLLTVGAQARDALLARLR